MREKYAYDMEELDAKFQARARYNKRRDSQCREQKKATRYYASKFQRDNSWSFKNRTHSAKKQEAIINDKWREYIEMPLANY